MGPTNCADLRDKAGNYTYPSSSSGDCTHGTVQGSSGSEPEEEEVGSLHIYCSADEQGKKMTWHL